MSWISLQCPGNERKNIKTKNSNAVGTTWDVPQWPCDGDLVEYCQILKGQNRWFYLPGSILLNWTVSPCFLLFSCLWQAMLCLTTVFIWWVSSDRHQGYKTAKGLKPLKPGIIIKLLSLLLDLSQGFASVLGSCSTQRVYFKTNVP